MKAQLWIDSGQQGSTKVEPYQLEFNHITQAMNYARFHNIKQYCVLLIDDSGYSLYDSKKSRWSFPDTELKAKQNINSMLA